MDSIAPYGRSRTTCKGIKREATCELTFDTRRVMRLRNEEILRLH